MSQLSSSISRRAEPTAPVEAKLSGDATEVRAAAPDRLVVRLAATDEDAAAIHAFLCAVAAQSGALRCPVNAEKSMREIWRVVRAFDLAEPGETPYGFALMAETGAELVGTLGVICPDWWYGDERFFTDRWFFARPGQPAAGPALLDEADALAREAGLALVINLKKRPRAAGSNVIYARFG